MIHIAASPSPFEQAKAHLVETMFYDQWAPSKESLVSKPRGTFLPKWEDIQDNLEPKRIIGKKEEEERSVRNRIR